jgi:hypothetical protein
MNLRPVTFREACAFVAEHHRHHKPPRGHKFSIGVEVEGDLVGVAMVGRPVARAWDDGSTCEVNRTCVDGTKNANSMLYGAAARAAKAMGYRRILTYTQEGESGSTLRAVGWELIGEREPRGSWAESSKGSLREMRDPQGNGGVRRLVWEKQLA